MLTRRELLGLALLGPWLGGCGGGDNPGPKSATQGGIELPVATTIADDDWPLSTPASQGIPASAMQTLLDEGAAHTFLYGVLVVRNGQLIGERYYNGGKSSDLRSVASVSKSVSSMLIGQTLAAGKIASTADTLGKLLPNELATTPNAYAAGITLQQLLDMCGGQQWDEATRQLDATGAPDMTAFALGLPSDGKGAGKVWNYTTASSHLLSPILRNANGVDALALATSKLFQPLGIGRAAWSRDASGMVHGSFGLQLRTRDLMKLAWMALQGGQWKGSTVVPAAWLTDSFTPHVKGLGDSGALKKIGYSNLWWSGTIEGLGVNLAWGYGGQFALLVPQLNMAIATASELNLPYNTADVNETAILNLIGRFLRAAQA
ncbi:serine hydrolase [Massilia sp. DJPM01]|uniref:serine hydrolase domain-containing protein n=1 Tax=Massilia sp. DJPM01 TaxID=3024404 RepID=UPI00259ECF7E|nr:serine hydrolase [Massilia sp. DJPM01]MDM5180179.1 serine hydrolase [Massilia sp. DJPM01]